MNKFRFIPLDIPGWYGVFDQDGVTRHPGTVTVSMTLPRSFTYTRELPPPAGKRKPVVLASITCHTVAELSTAIDEYFTKETGGQA